MGSNPILSAKRSTVVHDTMGYSTIFLLKSAVSWGNPDKGDANARLAWVFLYSVNFFLKLLLHPQMRKIRKK